MFAARILPMLTLGLVFGCAQPAKVGGLGDDDTRYSAASSRSRSFVPKVGDSYTWYKNGVIWSISDDSIAHNELSAFMLEEVKGYVVNQGYQFSEDSEDADYVLGVAVLDSKARAAGEASSFFQVTPGIVPHDNSQTATVVAAVIENEPWIFVAGDQVIQTSLLWRSSVEAFVLAKDVDMEIRKKRIRDLVRVLMTRFPSPE